MSRLRTRAADHSERSDAELLGAIADGDVAALGHLYDRYAKDVWRTVSRTFIDATDVEDVVHVTFLNLPRIASSYDGRESCRGWLYGIAIRRSMRHQRSAGRFRRIVQSFADNWTAKSWKDPEQIASELEEITIFENALGELSTKKRTVYVLVELEGLTSEEAAKALEVPAATVRTRLLHARRELHLAIERRSKS